MWSFSAKILKKTVFLEIQIALKGVRWDTLAPFARDVIFIINTGMQVMLKARSHILVLIVMMLDSMFLLSCSHFLDKLLIFCFQFKPP